MLPREPMARFYTGSGPRRKGAAGPVSSRRLLFQVLRMIETDVATSHRALPSGAALRRILAASLAGTTIEFFDFYIYATAAVLVFPALFFPRSDPGTERLQS